MALANDGAIIGVGGRVARLSGKHPTVRMVRETVSMDVYPETYTVAAEFIFSNDGAACTVKMGFPESGDGADVDPVSYRKKTSFLNFNTWVDGQPVAATREQADGSEESFKAFWVKTVTFAAHQSRTVRVVYRSGNGSVSDGLSHADYHFTGGNWKDKVERSDLSVTLHLPGANAVGFSDAMTREQDRFSRVWTNWQAEKDFEVDFYPTRPDAMSICGQGFYGESGLVTISVQPGKAAEPRWQPPVILRNGHPFISLSAWDNLNSYESPDKQRRLSHMTIHWDDPAKAVTITGDGRVVHVKLKQPLFAIEGRPSVSLPEGPFLSRPITADSGGRTGEMYVPLQQLAEAFGGSITIHLDTHEVEVHLAPMPKVGGEKKAGS